jgi:hypothetical protein
VGLPCEHDEHQDSTRSEAHRGHVWTPPRASPLRTRSQPSRDASRRARVHAKLGERCIGPANSTELPVAATVPRLRLGSIGVQSEEGPVDGTTDSDCGQLGWFFAFDLPDPLVPGVLQLAELAPSYAEIYEGFTDGCGYAEGWAAADVPAYAGELEIFAVTDTCVTGEIRGAVTDGTDYVWLRNGGFVAQRDNVACVPMITLECG